MINASIESRFSQGASVQAMDEKNKRRRLLITLFGLLISMSFLFFADIRVFLSVAAKENIKRQPSGCRHLKVVLPSLSCLACVRRIERKLRQTKGVDSVNVSLLADVKMDIIYSPTVISSEEVFKVVASEGYRVEKLK